jgi:hypothetical protein
MEQFLSINITAEIVNMPSYRTYWADSVRVDQIAGTMSRNRFDTEKLFSHKRYQHNEDP